MQAFLANVGQEEDWADVEKKALALGAEKMVIRDLQKEVRFISIVFPLLSGYLNGRDPFAKVERTRAWSR